MEQRRTGRWIARIAAVAAASVAVAGVMTGCAADAPTKPANTAAADIEAALQEPTTLTLWTWSTNVPDVVKAFEAEYPKIKIDVVNVGTGAAHYTKLQNAIKAGTGAPDIATMEYGVLPQYALGGSIVDLKQFGFEKYEDKFSAGAWDSVNVNGGLYELPHNAGPMALFYNKATFDKFGVDVPTTWDEYLDAARKIHAADPNSYIAADTGDAGFTMSMIWAFGGKPFQSNGETDLTIDTQDKGAKAYGTFYQQLLDEGLLAPISGWSNEWYQGLGNGTIATLATGAWMAGTLASGVKDGAGNWRVAPLPTVEKGDKASSMNGGGGFAILKQSKHQLAAAGFVQYMETGAGRDIWIKSGQFPSMKADLESKEFLDFENPYFGGQQVNKVFAQSAADVLPGWEYLPYNSYAGSIFGDTVGQAYLGKTTLNKGLAEWGDKLVQYGDEQGFTVNK